MDENVGLPEPASMDVGEEIEAAEVESRDWVDSRRYEAAAIRCAIHIVLRDTRLSAMQLSVMLGTGKTTVYRWMAGGFHGRPLESEALWRNLAEIREEERRPARRAPRLRPPRLSSLAERGSQALSSV